RGRATPALRAGGRAPAREPRGRTSGDGARRRRRVPQGRATVPAVPVDDRDAASGRGRTLDLLVPELPAGGGRLRGTAQRTLGGVGARFAIATPHVEATRAGAAAFDAGGNAVDAAL